MLYNWTFHLKFSAEKVFNNLRIFVCKRTDQTCLYTVLDTQNLQNLGNVQNYATIIHSY